jgi:hypothetical protein
MVILWSGIAVDLIGPWKVNIGGRSLMIQALTIIDVYLTLGNRGCYLQTRYNVFQNILARKVPKTYSSHSPSMTWIQNPSFPIESVPITINNPQANAICKRFHGTIQNQLWTIFYSNPPQDIGDTHNVIDSIIASIVFTSRVTIHWWTLGVFPGGFTFQRNMLHPIPILADFELIR